MLWIGWVEGWGLQVTPEQYEEFYKSTFKAWDKPLTVSHFSLEGQVRRHPRLALLPSLPKTSLVLPSLLSLAVTATLRRVPE